MGADDNIKFRGVDEADKGTAKGTDNTSTTTQDTRTETAGTGVGSGGSTAGTGETEKEVVSELVILNEQEKRDERNRRRRERYAQQKAENGGTVKPRKVNGNKAKQTAKQADNTQVKAIISTISTLVASRPNMAHWQLTPAEIESLATPISNIMAESEAFAKVAEHSDALALITACFTIFVPRVVISIATMPKKEVKGKNGGNVTDITSRPKSTTQKADNGTDKKSDIKPTTSSANVNQSEHWIGGVLA